MKTDSSPPEYYPTLTSSTNYYQPSLQGTTAISETSTYCSTDSYQSPTQQATLSNTSVYQPTTQDVSTNCWSASYCQPTPDVPTSYYQPTQETSISQTTFYPTSTLTTRTPSTIITLTASSNQQTSITLSVEVPIQSTSTTISSSSVPTPTSIPYLQTGSSSNGLSNGAIAGITFGGVAGLTIIGALIYWLVRQRRRTRDENDGKGHYIGSFDWEDQVGTPFDDGFVAIPYREIGRDRCSREQEVLGARTYIDY
jgi:hypothetical protein